MAAMMTSTQPPQPPQPGPIRISLIAGRYLLFSIDSVMEIRRKHGLCCVLTGTMPQNPTQNLFLGLPIELRAEEARLLVERGAAYIADETSDHLAKLKEMSSEAGDKRREAYLRGLKEKRRTAKRLFNEEKAAVKKMHEGKRKGGSKKEKAAPATDSLFESPTSPVVEAAAKKEVLPAITPSTSSALLDKDSISGAIADDELPESSAFYRYLNTRGYFTTPGLRFGGDYSAYPGDPMRYHAHFLANCYSWNDKIPMLDIVTSGRLGTAVKKSFLFGAEREEEEGKKEGDVRMFCVEWAGM
ncbi:hypothetical protein B0T21DRAFT_359077 [Apiosordaria backusii]|uniref:tRNA-splicing endonuclease subunit Sen34 n=1 Tax=Apiosordaria backusii TaxID=314023 RepID=A0AA40ET72_9PEZI|nr:hypothetical protein B0T21DRAFT_359077 [Apiosordaria backusii]